MFYFLKRVGHIYYFYNSDRNSWEGLKDNASTFLYSQIVQLEKQYDDGLHIYSYRKV